MTSMPFYNPSLSSTGGSYRSARKERGEREGGRGGEREREGGEREREGGEREGGGEGDG